MSAKPRIGLTTYARKDGWYRLPGEYVDSVRRAGGRAVMLPPGEEDLAGWLSDLDGLILTGGGDIDPRIWGGDDHPTVYDTDVERDTTEVELARLAVSGGRPVFGICRGMQILNIAFGGTLITHLPDRVGETVLHRAPPREPITHPVRVEPATRLAQALGALEIAPSSWHHQAVGRVPSRFVVTATAPDGTAEGFEDPSHPWLVAVQWHPEHTAGQQPDQHNLFVAFVDACR